MGTQHRGRRPQDSAPAPGEIHRIQNQNRKTKLTFLGWDLYKGVAVFPIDTGSQQRPKAKPNDAGRVITSSRAQSGPYGSGRCLSAPPTPRAARRSPPKPTGVNQFSAGVNVLRVGVQTLEMLDRWIHAKGRMFYPFADQSALNKLGLCNLSLTLPERFVSLGNLTRIGFGSKTIMFHAVGTTGSSKRAMLRAAVLRSTLLLPAFSTGEVVAKRQA